MKNVKKFLLTAAFATVLGVGAFAGFGASKDNSVSKAEAATTSPANTMTLYVLANGDANMPKDTANCGIALWNAANENVKVYYDAVRVGSTMFSCTIPTTYDRIDIVRTNPSMSFAESNWAAKYNDTGGITFNSGNNAVIVTGFSGNALTYSYTGVDLSKVQVVPSGSRYYIDLVNVNSWWDDATYDTYMTFMTSADYYGSYQHWYKANRIANTDFYYVDVVDGLCCNIAIIVRTNTNNWGPNQTANIVDLTDRGFIKVKNSGGDKEKEYEYSVLANNDNHMSWLFCNYFLTLSLCKDEGGLQTGAATEWAKANATYTDVYNALINKDAVKNIEADKDSEDTGKQAMARYDAVVAKNPSYRGDNNFIGRAVTPVLSGLASYTINASASSNSTMAIVLASIVAAVAAGGFIFFKKKSSIK